MPQRDSWFRGAPLTTTDRGCTLSFEELEQFAGRITQVVWGEFVAAEYEGQLPPRAASPAEVGTRAHAGALAFDTSCWFLGGPAELIARARARFTHTEEVTPEDWPGLD